MTDVIMPKLGESITEGTIIEWKKKVGDPIDLDETLLEISTDKVDSEVPSPMKGIVTELLFGPNDVVNVGEIIARITLEGVGKVAGESRESIQGDEEPKSEMGSSTVISRNTENVQTGKRKFYSPLVKSIAGKEGVTMAELNNIQGTGSGNRITKQDLLTYLDFRNKSQHTDISTDLSGSKRNMNESPVPSPDSAGLVSSTSNIQEKTVPMDRVRKKIADHMIASQRISAHVYSTSEADVTHLVKYRNNMKEEFKNKYGIRLTYTPMIMDAVIKGIGEFPMINSSIRGDDIVYHHHINIGVAVALPDDNLIVPVIHKSEELNFLGMARQVSGLAAKARENKLEPDEIFGSTFTITNPGIFGSLTGNAIINQPNVAILTVGAIQKRPVVKETEYGDAIVIRNMMYLTLGYDHRIIDGAYGTRFLTRVCQLIESFNPGGMI